MMRKGLKTDISTPSLMFASETERISRAFLAPRIYFWDMRFRMQLLAKIAKIAKIA
jgi:hypothetical protein